MHAAPLQFVRTTDLRACARSGRGAKSDLDESAIIAPPNECGLPYLPGAEVGAASHVSSISCGQKA